MSCSSLIPAVLNEGELYLLDVIGNEYAKWGTHHCRIRKAKQLCGLCLSSVLVAADDMYRTTARPGEDLRQLMVSEEWLADHYLVEMAE